MSRRNDLLAAEVRKQLVVQGEPELRRELRRELRDMENYAKRTATVEFEHETGEYAGLIEGKVNRAKRGKLPSGKLTAKDSKAHIIEGGRSAMAEHGETPDFRIMAKTALHWGGTLDNGDVDE